MERSGGSWAGNNVLPRCWRFRPEKPDTMSGIRLETSRGDSPVALPPLPECCKLLCLGLAFELPGVTIRYGIAVWRVTSTGPRCASRLLDRTR